MEKKSMHIKGMYRDILKDGDNNILYDSRWKPNKIVTDCRILLAALMKKEEGAAGIGCLKVGKGNPDWDADGPPPADGSEHRLEDSAHYDADELIIEYLDEDDEIVDGPTNRLQISATLGENEPPVTAPATTYPLREFGLFGNYGDTEYMIDLIRHPVINKDRTATLIRVVRLYF